MASNISRWLDDRTRTDGANSDAWQEGSEEKKVFGTNNDLSKMKTLEWQKGKVSINKMRHTTLYSVVSKFFKRLVAPQPLPSTTIVFFCESKGS